MQIKSIPLILLSATILASSCGVKEEFPTYEDYPAYHGSDLGLIYTKDSSQFKLWSPVASKVVLHLYEKGEGDNRKETVSMSSAKDGLWEVVVNKDLQGLFYTFQVETENAILRETPGIYAKAAGVNGHRAAVIDMEKTNPPQWNEDKRPHLSSISDAILYELHVRDYTIHSSAGSSYPGKYLGLAERGTKNKVGQATGLDHIRELGVSHVHLLPVFDYRSVDEAKLDSAQFNWGYDPQNYNVPEGSYATDPYDPLTRIREFKQMVKAFHDAGIRVVMDVVYNHTGETENSNFNLEVPGYYYRHTADGGWSDAASCGNETASERAMMRKYMIESCVYWVREYHVDGFRFDLMGIHDIETINQLTRELLAIEPTLIFYGEGWTAGRSPLPDSVRALKANMVKVERFAAFCDDLRDGLKGSVFEESAKGFVNGATSSEQSIRFGVVAATAHPQVDYSKINYSKAPWAREPWQCINYVSCHDNHTLADKLRISGHGGFSEEMIEKTDKLANGIVFTAQGIPFLLAGEEMMRTKRGVENSFNKPDSINRIDWNWKEQNADVVEFYQQIIALRRSHPVFRMTTAEQIRENLKFLDAVPNVVAYQLDGKAAGDSWNQVIVMANGNPQPVSFSLPEGNWKLVLDGGKVLATGRIIQRNLSLPASSLVIVIKD